MWLVTQVLFIFVFALFVVQAIIKTYTKTQKNKMFVDLLTLLLLILSFTIYTLYMTNIFLGYFTVDSDKTVVFVYILTIIVFYTFTILDLVKRYKTWKRQD